jgi:hypothetical protein
MALDTLTGATTPDPEDDTEVYEAGPLGVLQKQLAVTRASQLAERKKSWDNVAQALEKSRPSKSEMWFSLASALAQPTKTGSFGETLGNVSQTLGETRKAQREFDTSVAKNQFERDQDLAELGLKYDLKGYDLQGQAIKAGQSKTTVGDGGYWTQTPGQAPEWHAVSGAPSKVDQWQDSERNGVKGQLNQRTGEFKPFSGEAGGMLPAPLEKRKLDTLEEIGVLGSLSADSKSLADDIENGKLNLSLFGNMFATGANAVGLGDEDSAKFATFKSTLTKMKNDSLRLNKGTQTDRDAQAAWDELFGSLSSEKEVIAQLRRIDALNQRAAAYKAKALNEMLTSRGQDSIDLNEYGIQPTTVGSAAGKPKPKAAPASSGQRRTAPTAPPPKGAAPAPKWVVKEKAAQ